MCLTLQHSYPPGTYHRAFVDVTMLLETLKSTDTRIGEWVNVIGYITNPPSGNALQVNNQDGSVSHVQAIMLWSAGSINLAEYDKFLTGRVSS